MKTPNGMTADTCSCMYREKELVARIREFISHIDFKHGASRAYLSIENFDRSVYRASSFVL